MSEEQVTKTKNNLPKDKDGKIIPGPGRPPGTINKKRLFSVEQYLVDKQINPVQEVLNLIPQLRPAEQLQAWALLFKYCYKLPEAEAQNPTDSITVQYTKIEQAAQK